MKSEFKLQQASLFRLLQTMQRRCLLLGVRLHLRNLLPLYKHDVISTRSADWSRALGFVYVVEGARGRDELLRERAVLQRRDVQ